MNNYVEGEVFIQNDYSKQQLSAGEYENCSFRNCNFSNSSLKARVFVDCEFIDCDLSNVDLNLTSLKNINFEGCKMIGLQFEHCNNFMFEVQFTKCQLNLSSFYQRSLAKKTIRECTFQESDLAESNCEQTKFEQCDFKGANFDGTTLIKSDFRSSYNYQINPEQNNVKKAKFAYPGIIGLLSHLNISIE